jgi:hypothetical protein
MFAKFGQWLQGPTPEQVTLEMIGLVKGTKDIERGEGNYLAAESAGRIARRADRVLKAEGRVLDRDVREFLTAGRDHFAELSKLKSSEGTGRYFMGPYMTYEIQKPDPEWDRAFQTARSKLDVQATRVFSTHFAPGLRDQIESMSAKDVAKKADEVALLHAHTKKIAAP